MTEQYFTICFATAVDDERYEDVELIEETDEYIHVATHRAAGPRFYLRENGRVDLKSAKLGSLVVEDWGRDWQRVDAQS